MQTLKKNKYFKWFWPVTEGITLLTWKRIIKHYIEDLFLKPSKIKKSLKNYKSGQNWQKFCQKNVFITKISKTFDFFGQKSKKNVMFFSVLLYGITPKYNCVCFCLFF